MSPLCTNSTRFYYADFCIRVRISLSIEALSGSYLVYGSHTEPLYMNLGTQRKLLMANRAYREASGIKMFWVRPTCSVITLDFLSLGSGIKFDTSLAAFLFGLALSLMFSFVRQLLYLQLLLVFQLQSSRCQTCYHPDGSVSPDTPCTNSVNSACCSVTAWCLDNGLWIDKLILARGSCTDRTRQSTACPIICRDCNVFLGSYSPSSSLDLRPTASLSRLYRDRQRHGTRSGSNGGL